MDLGAKIGVLSLIGTSLALVGTWLTVPGFRDWVKRRSTRTKIGFAVLGVALLGLAVAWLAVPGSQDSSKSLSDKNSSSKPIVEKKQPSDAPSHARRYRTTFFHSQAPEGADWLVDGNPVTPADPPTLSLTTLMVPEGAHEVTATRDGEVCVTHIQIPVSPEKQPITLTCKIN